MMATTHINDGADNDRMYRLKTEAQDELIRFVNRNTAVAVMEVERQRRVHQTLMHGVLSALVSASQRKEVAKAERDEQQSRVAAHTWQYGVAEEIRAWGARRSLAEAEEKERSDRLLNYPSPAKLFSQTRVSLHESIVRNANAAAADTAAEEERTERVQQELLRSVGEEIVRKVARRQTMKAADEEQLERVAADSLHAVCEEIRRTAAISNSKAAADIEQRRRIEDLNHAALIDPLAVADYFGPAAVASQKLEALETIERLGSVRAVIKAAEEEQQNRCIRVNMLQVCDEIERRHAQREVDLAVKHEQQSRIVDDIRHSLCSEIRSEFSRQWSNMAAVQEQIWRVNSGIDRTYWVVDPVRINESKQETNSLILRMGSIAKAKSASDEEKQRRIMMNMVHEVCCEVRRAVNQRSAMQAADVEQAQRIAQEKMQQVCESIRKSANVQTVIKAAESEKRLRCEDSTGCLVNLDKTPVNESIERRGNQSSAVKAMESERLERIQRNHMYDVCGQLHRRMSVQKAIEASNDVKAKAVFDFKMRQVFDSLIQLKKRKSTTTACEQEQLDLIESTPSNLLEFQPQTIKSLLAEITARAC